jgi:Ca2+-binding RTX toxin-like protein
MKRQRRPTKSKITLKPSQYPPVYARGFVSPIEPLERRCLMSVSATTIIGPTAAGQERDFESVYNGNVTDTAVRVNEGQTTFNGAAVNDSRTTFAGGTVDNTYDFLVNGALISYGGTDDASGTLDTTTINPPYTFLPATVVGGTSYTSTYTSTSVNTGVVNSSSSTVYRYIAVLPGESTSSVTVPAGTYPSYQLNVTYQTLTNGSVSSSAAYEYFYTPTIGFIKSIDEAGSQYPGLVFELTGTGSVGVTGTPVQLAVTQSPASASLVGSNIGTVQVQIEDGSGNLVNTATSNVTVALTGVASGTLDGTRTEAAVGGIATFNNLTVNAAGTYTLTVTDGSLNSTESGPFNVISFATFSGGALTVNGTAGDDAIGLTSDGTNVTATLNGTASPAFTLSSVTSITVNGNAGSDSITLDSSLPSTLGVSVQGGPGDDTIIGGPGNDTLGGGQGNDSIQGGPGDDSVKGGAGDDTLLGGKGNDTLFGGPGNDLMHGGLGDDYLNGGAGTDYMSAGAGNNTFYAVNGTADQVFAGTATNDSLFYSTADSPIIESGSIPAGNQTLVS